MSPTTRRLTRATVELSELRGRDGENAGHALERFVDERLITVDANTAQITHDALLTAWPRLRSWIDAGRETCDPPRIGEAGAGLAGCRAETAALWRGSQLAIARDWSSDEDKRASLGTLAAEFVSAAIAEDQARQRGTTPHPRRLQRLVAALTVLVVAVCGLAAYAFQQRQAAGTPRDNANSREIAVEAGQVRGLERAGGGAAQRCRLPDRPDAAGHREPARVLRLARGRADPGLRGRGPVGQPDARPQGARGRCRRRDAAAVEYRQAGTSRAGRRPAGARQRRSAVHNRVQPGRQDPGGRRRRAFDLAVERQQARRIHVPLGKPADRADQHHLLGGVQPGRQDAGGRSADNKVRLWNVSDPAQPVLLGKPLTGATGYIESVAFAPDGTMLALGSADGTVRLIVEHR